MTGVQGARRVSTLDHWESYWKGHADLDRTYSTGGRLMREVTAEGPVAGRRVMEVGAGSGRDLLALARAGAVGVVLDYSPASLELVRRQAREQDVPVLLVQADALRMPFRDGAFDVVFHQGLLEHFRDPMPLLRENARVTARGGRVIVDVPQTYHPYTLMKQTLIALNRWFAGWETQFTPAGLERLLAANERVGRPDGDELPGPVPAHDPVEHGPGTGGYRQELRLDRRSRSLRLDRGRIGGLVREDRARFCGCGEWTREARFVSCSPPS